MDSAALPVWEAVLEYTETTMSPLSLLLVLGCAQSELPAAEALLDRLEQRIAEPAARAAVKNVVMRGSIAVPGMDAAGRFEELHAPGAQPERVLVRQEFASWPAATQGTDGTISWTTDPGFGIAIKEGDEQGPMRRLWAIGRSAPWRTLYSSAKTVGEAERDGRAVYELEMRPHAGAPERWSVERQTSELLAIAFDFPNPTGGKLPMEYLFADWKPVDGVRYAHRRVQRVMGMEITYTIDSIEHPPELDPARLAPPPEVLEAIADRSKRTPEPPANPEECALQTIEPRTVASIRTVIDKDRISENLAQLLTEVMRVLGEQGVDPAGPPFSRYHRIDNEKNEIDIEAGIPVRAPLKASGRVEPGELPGGKVALTWHVGPYTELPRSYARLEAWMRAQELAAGGAFWEIYWTDPGIEPDPEDWKTQVLWPVE